MMTVRLPLGKVKQKDECLVGPKAYLKSLECKSTSWKIQTVQQPGPKPKFRNLIKPDIGLDPSPLDSTTTQILIYT